MERTKREKWRQGRGDRGKRRERKGDRREREEKRRKGREEGCERVNGIEERKDSEESRGKEVSKAGRGLRREWGQKREREERS